MSGTRFLPFLARECQEGNSGSNWITEAATSGDKVVFGANVNEDWEEVSAGYTDFAVTILDLTVGHYPSYYRWCIWRIRWGVLYLPLCLSLYAETP